MVHSEPEAVPLAFSERLENGLNGLLHGLGFSGRVAV